MSDRRFISFGARWHTAAFLVLGTAALVLSGCLPYTMGTTARTVEPDELRPYSTLAYVPSGAGFQNDEDDSETIGYPLPSAGARYGLDAVSDLGIRAPGLGGIVLDYKRRVAGDSLGRTSALAFSGGTGIVNGGNHAYVEASMVISGPEREKTLTPYGGVRAMHTFPISDVATSDLPTVGGFAGLRIGTREVSISPEIGVFYDSPALGLREHDVIVVPAVTLHGVGLLDIFR